MARAKKPKKTTTEITQAQEACIVEVSLEHPDFGAGRLVPLLEQKGVLLTASAVYTILKRNNLQNRTLRLSKLKERRPAEIVPASVDDTPPSNEQGDPFPTCDAETTPLPRLPAVLKNISKTRVKSLWSLNPANILLLGLVGYFWVSALGNLLEARREPTLPHSLAPAPVESRIEATVRPLEDYNIIVERNLFGGSKGQASAPQEEVSLEGLPVALKVLGLKLVGTVVGDDAAVNLAIIDDQSTRKQDLYREGDQVGQALVKKILRNKVVLNTGSGDEVLTMEPEEIAASSSAHQQTLASLPPTPADSDDLTREEIESALPEYTSLMHQIRVRPHFEAGKPGGFMIYNIEPGSIYAKMGLEDGDVIKNVNGQPIETTQQAVDFYNSLKEGGAVTLEIKRGEDTQELRFAIQ